MSLSINTEQLLKEKPDFDNNISSFSKIENNQILVTGGAGFLGIHLLKDLVLSAKYEKIYTIVRDKSKLFKQTTYFGLDNDWLKDIHIIEGDLLSLNDKDFPQVEYIIHSAAEIHCLKNRNKLWNNNVNTTLKLAKIYQNNKFNFISTLSVFVSSNQKGIHKPEPVVISEHNYLYGGYAQTKFIGEQITQEVKGQIIRLGLITGSSNKGIFPQDFFTSFVELINKIGKYPEDYENSYVDMTPVNYAVNEIINNLNTDNKIIHIANKESTPLSDFIDILKLKKVSNDEWMQSIKKEGSLHQYLLKYAFFKNEMLESHFDYFNLDLFQSTGHEYFIEKRFPLDNKNMLKLYLDTIINKV